MPDPTTTPAPRAVSVAQFARALSLSDRTARRMIKRKEVATVRFGSAVRVPVTELDRLLGVEPTR